jgi:hypothetical protein
MRISDLNHFEWQIARSFCVREGPRCDSPGLPSKRVDPTLAGMASNVGGCPLRTVCFGRKEPVLLRLQEPLSRTSYY